MKKRPSSSLRPVVTVPKEDDPPKRPRTTPSSTTPPPPHQAVFHVTVVTPDNRRLPLTIPQTTREGRVAMVDDVKAAIEKQDTSYLANTFDLLYLKKDQCCPDREGCEGCEGCEGSESGCVSPVPYFHRVCDGMVYRLVVHPEEGAEEHWGDWARTYSGGVWGEWKATCPWEPSGYPPGHSGWCGV